MTISPFAQDSARRAARLLIGPSECSLQPLVSLSL